MKMLRTFGYLGILVGTLLLVSPVQAANNSKGINGFYITVDATNDTPAAGGDPFHTGGASSMNIAFAGTISGGVLSDGNWWTDTYWDVLARLYVDNTSNMVDALGTTGFPPTPYVLQGGVVDYFTVSSTQLSGNRSVSAGGHTSHTSMEIWCQDFTSPDMPVYVRDSVNFSIINP
ncbi:MAG: hypothetical protein ACK47B_04910 [Armatimonadota bacterium]